MKRNIRLYYLFHIFSQLFFWLPIYYEFQKKIGLSDSEIFGIQTVYYAAFCVLELPTGLIADRIGRLQVLRLGAGVLLVSHILAVSFHNYLGFLSHFTLIAVARAFFSGACSAYVYDYLAALDRTSEYRTVEGRAKALSLVGRVVCWPAVGFMMEINPNLPYYLTLFSVIIAGVISFMMYSDGIQKSPRSGGSPTLSEKTLWGSIEPVFQLVWCSSKVQILILQGIAIFIMARLCQVNLFQPLLKQREFSIGTFGMIMSFLSILEAVGATYSQVLRRWFSEFDLVTLLSSIASLMLFVVAVSGQYGTILGLAVFSLVVGMYFPLQRQLLNDSVTDSSVRATVLSFESLVDRVGCTWAVWMLGSFIKVGQLNSFLLGLSGWTALSSILLFVIARKNSLFYKPQPE